MKLAIAVVLSVFSALVFLSGCAGQGGEANQLPPASQPSQPSGEVPLVQQAQTGGRTVSPEQAASELKSIFGKQADLEYSVNYLIVSRISGSSNNEYFVKKGQGYNCSKASGEWVCPSSGKSEVQTPIDVTMWYLDGKNYAARWEGNRQIAGTSASCYEVTNVSSFDRDIHQYCFSSEGVMLYMGTRKPDQRGLDVNWTATRYAMGLD